MQTKAVPVTEYLVCLPDAPGAAKAFSGVVACQSDSIHLCLTIHACKGQLEAQAGAYQAKTGIPIGILAAPHRFRRALHMVMQAYTLAKKFQSGTIIWFDNMRNTTEYQFKYSHFNGSLSKL